MRQILQGVLTLVCISSVAYAAAAESPQQTRVVWNASCSVSAPDKQAEEIDKGRSGILGDAILAVAPKLIDGAVDAAANALKAAGDSKSITSTARSGADFYEINPKGDLLVPHGCVRVVRGDYTAAADAPRDGLAAIEGLEGLKAASASFVFEARVEPLRGLKLFRLVPVLLRVQKFSESTIFSNDERGYTIALSLAVPGATAPFGSASFTFPSVKEGESIQEGDWRFANAVSEPIAFAPESADAAAARAKRQGAMAPYLLAMDIIKSRHRHDAALAGKGEPVVDPIPSVYRNTKVMAAAAVYCKGVHQYNEALDESARSYDERCKYVMEPATATLEAAITMAHHDSARFAWAQKVCGTIESAKGQEDVCSNFDGNTPAVRATYFSSTATLVETRAGSKFAKFLGEALGAGKADVSAAIAKKVIPETSEQKDAATQGERDARRALILAEMQVTQAEEALAAAVLEAKPAEITSARIVHVKAKIAVNDAYRKAGSAHTPYPELD